jgi:hypothetical protein
MNIKAPVRPARAGRRTTRLSEARHARRPVHPITRRAQARPVSHWIVSAEGRLVRVWDMPGRRALSSTKRGSDA